MELCTTCSETRSSGAPLLASPIPAVQGGFSSTAVWQLILPGCVSTEKQWGYLKARWPPSSSRSRCLLWKRYRVTHPILCVNSPSLPVFLMKDHFLWVLWGWGAVLPGDNEPWSVFSVRPYKANQRIGGEGPLGWQYKHFGFCFISVTSGWRLEIIAQRT